MDGVQRMINKSDTKCCGNCGFVEQEYPSRKVTPMYCTNCESEHCSEWVHEDDYCPLWIRWTDSTKYYNIVTDRGY